MLKALDLKVDAILDRLTTSGRGSIKSYSIALGLVCFALLARVLTAPIETGLPFLAFFPAVTLAALFGGIGPGVFAMAISSILATYLFMPPFQTFTFQFQPTDVRANMLFWAEQSIVILAVDILYRRRDGNRATEDIRQRLQSAEQELQLASAAFQAQEGIMITDANGVILRVNRIFSEMTGFSAEEAIGKTPRILKSGRHAPAFYTHMWESVLQMGSWQGEIWDKRKDGEIYPKWLTIAAVKNAEGAVTHFVGTQTDITSRKAAEEAITTLAFYDPLTGLPNRRMLQDRLQLEIKKSQRTGLPLALLMIDLDHFKEVNDTLGHDHGDILLQKATKRLLACVREADTVARQGGDEFTIILSGLEDPSNAERVAQAVLDALSSPFSLQGEHGYVSASIGITLFPNDAPDIGQLLKNADQAMYAAKSMGRNRYSYFTPSMQDAALSRLRMTNDLRAALAGEQFEIHYQPIVELATGNTYKAEALIRWNHPQQGLVSPAQFIPLAETSGLIHEIGDWVFHIAATQVKQWRSRLHGNFQISINKSPVQFHSSNHSHQQWMEELAALGLPGESLVIEITEGLLMETQGNAHQKLLEFRDANIQVAIDDFGTGYSALSYLKKFDIDYLKIDQSFTRNLAPESSDLALCEAMIVMAHKLGLMVIAEGVETQAHKDLLAAAGCDYGQGYFFARPMPVEKFDEWYANRYGTAESKTE